MNTQAHPFPATVSEPTRGAAASGGRELGRRGSPVALVVVLLGFTMLWAAYPQSFTASDPWRYSLHAVHIAEGAVRDGTPDHPFGHRLGVTLPVAVIYRLVGVSVHSTHAWPLAAALAILVVVWLAAESAAARTYAVVLCALSVPLVRSAVSLYPDGIATALAAAAALLLARRRDVLPDRPGPSGRTGRRPEGSGSPRGADPGEDAGRARTGRTGTAFRASLPVIAIALLAGGVLAKETALWIAPLWLAVIVHDVRRGERALVGRFHVPAAIAGLVLLAGYLWLCGRLWGDPLARLHSLNAVSDEHLWSLAATAPTAWLKRLSVAPLRVLLVDYGITAIPAALALGAAWRRRSFWAAYALVTVGMFWLAPTSLTAYSPIAATWRNALLCLPGLAVLAGEAGERLTFEPPGGPHERSGRWRTLAPFALVAGLAALPLLAHLDLARREPRAEAAAMARVRDAVATHPDRSFVLLAADSRSAEALAFYFGYRWPANLAVAGPGQRTGGAAEAVDTTFVFLDEDRSRMLAERYGEADLTTAIRRLGLSEVVGSGPVHLFEAPGRIDLPP